VRDEAGIAAELTFARPNQQTTDRNGAKPMRLPQSPDEIATASIRQANVAQKDVKSPSRRDPQGRRNGIDRQNVVTQIRQPNGQRCPSRKVILNQQDAEGSSVASHSVEGSRRNAAPAKPISLVTNILDLKFVKILLKIGFRQNPLGLGRVDAGVGR
jgi:hypothetical protein